MKKKVFVLAICFFASVPNLGAALHQYQIEVEPNLSSIRVEACFDGKVPNYLSVDNSLGNEDLISLPDSKQGDIEIQGRFWKTGNLPENACLNYQVSIERHHTKQSKRKNYTSKVKSRNKLIAYIEQNTWLWLPESLNEQDDIEINILLPKGMAVSTPWQPIPSEANRFRLGHYPQEWGYTFILGDFSQRDLKISDGHHLSITSLKDLAGREQIDNWLIDIARGVERYLGDYPVKQTQVIVIAKKKKKQGPVPWGDFSRGNGFGIRFVVVPSYDIKEFYADWTATHEFSHQLLPKLVYDDIWLSEGLASYLQYVLMAQSGVLTQEQAWMRIFKGLKRGEAGTKKFKNEPLNMTSGNRKRGGRSGRTMRIYWSGALYFLKADLALREQSKGRVGLNDILLKLNRCCITGSKIWTGKELAAKLDSLSGSKLFNPRLSDPKLSDSKLSDSIASDSKIFSGLYSEFSNGFDFPEYLDSLEKLGVIFSDEKRSSLEIKQHSIATEIMRKNR